MSTYQLRQVRKELEAKEKVATPPSPFPRSTPGIYQELHRYDLCSQLWPTLHMLLVITGFVRLCHATAKPQLLSSIMRG